MKYSAPIIITDSIKERVKRAGGQVTGELRASLAWFNFDDLPEFSRLGF